MLDLIADRAAMADPPPMLAPAGLLGVLAVAAIGASWWPAWRVLRLAVTLVHELGHAIVGMLAGRQFRGFVLNADMSGHAVTVGRPRGVGVIATTWAGYPAPAAVGALLVWLASKGASAPVLTLLVLGTIGALLFVRSALTALVVLAVLATLGGLWWWRDDVLQQQVLVGVGVLLLVGAWRHLIAVIRHADSGSDPATLARLTPLPMTVWLVSFVIVTGLSSWVVVAEVLTVLRH